MEDKEIIDLYFDRDESAIQESEKKYGGYCFTTAYNILFDKEESEECVNDTWNKSWQLIPPERPKFLKYFFAKITRGFALNVLRKNTREKRGGKESDICFEELENVLDDGSDPEKEYHASELKEVLNRFLGGLKERDRNVFLRRYFYMESVDKITSRYGLSESNVNVILHRVRNELKDYLEKEGY